LVLAHDVEITGEVGDLPTIAMRFSRQRVRETTQAAFDEAIAASIDLQKEIYASGELQAPAETFFEKERR
jgi:hypothetical protein